MTRERIFWLQETINKLEEERDETVNHTIRQLIDAEIRHYMLLLDETYSKTEDK